MNISNYLERSAQVLLESGKYQGVQHVETAITRITGALEGGNGLLVCGNGGSASDAMHITGELVGRFLKERQALRCICLSSNPSVLTAWANDYEYDTVFSRQVEAYGDKGGVLLGLSTSGNSQNVVLAFKAAKTIGMTTIALTGEGGGELAACSDILIDVPSRSTPMIQQVHICLYHYICQQVETEMLPA